jgi:hypothetical protein
MANIFVSYGSPDRTFVASLIESLRKFGHTVHSDTDLLTPGTDWQTVLTDSLRSSDALVSVVSSQRQTLSSSWRN